MAKLVADNQGNLVRFFHTADEEARWGAYTPPVGATVIVFDEAANAAVVQALDQDWNAHAVVNGHLQHNGQDVTLAGPGQAHTDRLAIDAIIAKLAADQALTPVELRVIFRHMARKMGLL